jgi:glycosyltransferase involved in cell wall biosynthesis
MKKILLISFEYPVGRTYCGGVGQIVKQCRKALLELGYEVYLLISPEFNKKRPVKLLLPCGSLVRYANFSEFEKEYDWSRFNYVIQHFVNWTKKLRRLKNHKSIRPRIIYHFHSILRRERDAGFRTFNHFLLNQERMIDIADKIVCPSRYEYDNFIRYFPYFGGKVSLVENTIEAFGPDKSQIQEIKGHYGIKEDDIVSIYVGRLERIKGADVLITYMPKILKRHKRLKIFIIGKALERDLYKKLMLAQRRFPRQVFYIKYLEKKRLFQYFYLSCIYLNTSLSESFSLATHESALCNNALLLSDLAVFDKFKDAALFFSAHEGGDDFIRKFENLVKDKRLREGLSRKAARVARDFLTKNRLKEDLHRLLKSF